MKNFCLIGISYKSVSSDTLQKCSLKGEKLLNADKVLSAASFEEFTIVSTCNRCEIYFTCEDPKIFETRTDILEGIFGKNAALFSGQMYLKVGKDAIMHLFLVASGVDSELTGETEILGQIKDSYFLYSKNGFCKNILNQIFQKAIHTGKWIRSNTRIGHGKITVGSVAAELTGRIFDDIKQVKILLMGSGAVGSDVAKSLSVRGAKQLTVCSRSWENAKTLSINSNSSAIVYENALKDLSKWDIIICALACEEAVVTKDTINRAMEKRKMASMFIMDLGMPRNVEESCSDIEGVFLYNLSDLSKISNENINLLKSEIAEACSQIESRSGNFYDKLFGA